MDEEREMLQEELCETFAGDDEWEESGDTVDGNGHDEGTFDPTDKGDMPEEEQLPQKQREDRHAEEGEHRDFGAEALELLKNYPQLRGRQLPDEVLADCARGMKLLEAYRSYETREQRTQLEQMRRENEILRHNAEAARRGPVWGVGVGGGPDNGHADPFLDGFLAEF